MLNCDELKIIEENEKVSFCMEILNEIETSMKFKFEKTSRYRSTTISEWNNEDFVSLELFETSEYITRFPGCQLSWRARFFRDTYQEPHRYTVSLQLLSCELERLQTTEVTRVTARCWLRLDKWRKQMVNIEFDPRMMQEPGLFPISENVEIDRKMNEKILPEWTDGPLFGSDELFVRLDVHVHAQLQLKDLVLFNYGPGDFTIQRPIKLVHEEEENLVSLHKMSLCVFNITVRSFRFEKLAKYSSSGDLKLFQSRIFRTDICHPEGQLSGYEMSWRVRYFRDTFKKPIQHSLGLQLKQYWLKSTEHAHVRVTCQLRINNWRLKSALVADFDMQAEEQFNRITQLDGNKIEKLLAEAKDELTVGLVVRVDIYRKSAPAEVNDST